MTRDPKKFQHITSIDGGNVTFGDDNKGKIIGIGLVGKEDTLTFNNPMLVCQEIELTMCTPLIWIAKELTPILCA